MKTLLHVWCIYAAILDVQSSCDLSSNRNDTAFAHCKWEPFTNARTLYSSGRYVCVTSSSAEFLGAAAAPNATVFIQCALDSLACPRVMDSGGNWGAQCNQPVPSSHQSNEGTEYTVADPFMREDLLAEGFNEEEVTLEALGVNAALSVSNVFKAELGKKQCTNLCTGESIFAHVFTATAAEYGSTNLKRPVVCRIQWLGSVRIRMPRI